MIGQNISSNSGSPTSGGGPTTSASESADGEDQEDSSSSSNLRSNNTDDDDELASFREQWQRELEISSKSSLNIVGNNAPDPAEVNSLAENCENVSAESLEIKAKALFLKGVEHEQSGKLYEAIQFYKRAVQLVPDVEFKLYEASKPKINEKKQQMDSVSNTDNLNSSSQGSLSSTENAEDDDDLEGEDLFIRLQRFISRCSRLCFPEFDANCTHISALPMEIVLYILRWVVSSDLDLRSLEKFGSTCRGFYLCSRDSEIWRLACIRVWGVNCGTPGAPYASWRQMFVERPRLHFNGCYISKTTYLRHGENSFQDQFYRPWHLVEYYRYLRFFPDGTVLMLTTPDEPAQCVNQLRSRNPRNANVLVGHYRLWDRTVTLFVQRQDTKYVTGHRLRMKRRDSVVDKQSQTFHLELQIQNHRKRKNAQLIFTRYAVFTRNHNGTESSSNFELVGARYPPLWFSRVKSYTAESESPLQ